MLTGIDCDSQWDIGNCCHNVGAATLIRRTRYGGEEGGAGYRLMDINTRPQQGGIIDYPANMQRSLNTACRVTVAHRLIHFSSVCCRVKSQCRCGKPVLQIIASFTFFVSVSLITKEWAGTKSSSRTWPSGLSSSALTTSELYDG